MKYIFLITYLIFFSNSNTAENKRYMLKINNGNILIYYDSKMTILDLKKNIQPYVNVSINRIKLLIYSQELKRNIELKNDKTCGDYNLEKAKDFSIEYYYRANQPFTPIG